MRKFFMMVAVVALALLVATPSMALDFKFGAEYRVRFYSYTASVDGGAGSFGDGNGTSPRGVQTRIRPRFDVSDDNGNMTATLRLEIGDIEWGNGGGAHATPANGVSAIPSGARIGNGSGGGLDADGINVETKWAYVDFASPFGVPLRWRAGIQPWYLPKGIIIDNDVSGLRAYGNYSMVNYEASWYRASGGPCTNTAAPTSWPTTATQCTTSNSQDNNLDFYQAKVDVAVAKWLNPGVYYIYGRNASSATAAVNSQNFFGATITGDLGFLKYDFDFVYGQQEGGNAGTFASTTDIQDVKGWMIDAGVHIPIGPVLLHVVGSYATGDQQDGGESEAMPYIGPSWNGAGGLYELAGAGGVFDVVNVTQDYPAGLWMLGAGAEYRPVKALWLRAMYGFIGFTGPSANCAYNASGTFAGGPCYGPRYTGNGYVRGTGGTVDQGNGGLAGKTVLGHEINLRADWDLWTNFKVQAMAGWLIPTEGATAQEYVVQLYYNF